MILRRPTTTTRTAGRAAQPEELPHNWYLATSPYVDTTRPHSAAALAKAADMPRTAGDGITSHGSTGANDMYYRH